MSAAPDTWALIGTLDTQLTNSAQQRESIRQALAAMADLPDTVRRDLIAALAAKPEQPAPTGEVTREHRAAVVDLPERSTDQLAQLLATREAAAYQRGLSARGEWVAVGERLPPDNFTRLVSAGFRTVAYFEYGKWWRVGSLGKPEELTNVTHWQPLPPPPSDPSKGGR